MRLAISLARRLSKAATRNPEKLAVVFDMPGGILCGSGSIGRRMVVSRPAHRQPF
jgi:hypothetical protein